MISKVNVCDQIVEEVISSIVDGRLKAGDKLPNERDMAQMYGVSRVPLREALRSLRQMGIIITKHGIGTYVNEVNTRVLSNQLNSYLLLQKKPVIEVLQLRRLLEVESARLAAQKATEQELEKIRAAELFARNEVLKLAEGQEGNFYVSDLQFHLAIAEASHNSLFADFVKSIQGTLHLHQLIYEKETHLEDIAACHMMIREAIEERNPEKAAQMMLYHLDRLQETVLKALGENSQEQ